MRVRRGVNARDIERAYSFPVNVEVYDGAILPVMPPPSGFCRALPHDSYAAIAEREGVDVRELAELNGNSPVYPCKKVWLP